MPPCNPCLDNFPNFPFGFGPWGDWNRPRSSNCPPSPTPPWARAIQSPQVQVITMNDAINIDMLMTFLNVVKRNPSVPVQVSIPNGTYLGQAKQIFIGGSAVTLTETFIVSGTFSGGFSKLQFDSLGFAANLVWDGSGWSMVGGNATLLP